MSGATRSRTLGPLALALAGLMSMTGCAPSTARRSTRAADEINIGYGTQPRGTVTSAIASLDRAQIARHGSPSIVDLLMRVPGVSVTGVGAQAVVRIRSAPREPLVVIDDIPRLAGVSALLTLTPADIERIDVLKDGAAASAYGHRGGNGVILVQTRRRK